ncbi:hypothetical protein [Adhaeribacter soli]|uniref:hypothetical protein n=1 Tax=Adhaeribacter soli TaxID=2607655 RepID=UPI001245ACA8|nr:hypothetical protein [Adhaeribacter soli]
MKLAEFPFKADFTHIASAASREPTISDFTSEEKSQIGGMLIPVFVRAASYSYGAGGRPLGQFE